MYWVASLRMVSIIAPRTTAIRVPPFTFGGRVGVTVGVPVVPAAAVGVSVLAEVAAPVGVSDPVPAVVAAADGEAAASAGEVAEPEVSGIDCVPDALGVLVLFDPPDAQADSMVSVSTTVSRTDTVFHSLRLVLYILLSLHMDANRTGTGGTSPRLPEMMEFLCLSPWISPGCHASIPQRNGAFPCVTSGYKVPLQVVIFHL